MCRQPSVGVTKQVRNRMSRRGMSSRNVEVWMWNEGQRRAKRQ